MSSDGKRIEALRRLLAEAHQKLGLKLGFSLWDGSRVPADWPADGLAVALRDPGLVAALIRRPKLDTLLHLHIADRIAIENGTIFDLAAARPEGKVGRLARTIPKGAVFDVLLIRHTLEVTTWGERKAGDFVNFEVDTMARYAARLAEFPASKA